MKKLSEVDKGKLLYDDRYDLKRKDYEKKFSLNIKRNIILVIILGLIIPNIFFYKFGILGIIFIPINVFSIFFVLCSINIYNHCKKGIQLYDNGICLYGLFYFYKKIECIYWTPFKYNKLIQLNNRANCAVFNQNDILNKEEFLQIIKNKVQIIYNHNTSPLQTSLPRAPKCK